MSEAVTNMAAAVTNINATTSVNKPVDLQKIFTPADDTEEIRPQKNRKLYFTTTKKQSFLDPYSI